MVDLPGIRTGIGKMHYDYFTDVEGTSCLYIIYDDGIEEYYKVESTHYFTGNEAPYKRRLDCLHRCNGPAVIFPNGKMKWFVNGLLHRTDGPAIDSERRKVWYINGRIHREDGPAVIRNIKDEISCEFYIEGIGYNPVEYMEHPLVSEETVEDIVANWIMYWKRP